MDYRIEKDTMGEVSVPAHAYFGAQTQRSIDNFKIAQNINKIEKLPYALEYGSRNLIMQKEGYPLYSFNLIKQLYVDPQTGNAVDGFWPRELMGQPCEMPKVEAKRIRKGVRNTNLRINSFGCSKNMNRQYQGLSHCRKSEC